MNKYIKNDYLLSSHLAYELYENYARDLPIVDYHCHLSAKEIYENKRFENIFDLLLKHDHYKWKLLRSSGIDEEYITGSQSNEEKFRVFSEVLSTSIGNVLYHWTHLEYARFFDNYNIIKKENIDILYEELNNFLKENIVTPMSILKKCRVEFIGTTDEIFDDLKYHELLKESALKVVPTFRADKLLYHNNYLDHLNVLETICFEIKNLDDFEKVIIERIEYFKKHRCVSIDIGMLENTYQSFLKKDVAIIFEKIIANENILNKEQEIFNSYVLHFLMKEAKKNNFVVQLHVGVIRNINLKNVNKINSGFDISNNSLCIQNFIDLFNDVYELPKTIIYSLNKEDNFVLNCFVGAYQGSNNEIIYVGPPWWFNDHLEGFNSQFDIYKQATSLNNYLGMTTDSRSFLSLTRHEYFRRIFCSYLAQEVEKGSFPKDLNLLQEIIENVCYKNAKKYFA